MVHELLGIQNGRVDLSKVPEIRPELSVSGMVSLPFLQSSCARRILGNHIDNKHRPFLPITLPLYLWGTWNFIEGLCPAISVSFHCPRPIFNYLHFRYETFCRRVP